MKKLLIIFAVVLFMAGFATKVSAQVNPSVSVSNSAGGEIMSPLTIEANEFLEFGRLAVKSTEDGTVVIAPNATLGESATGGVSLMPLGNARKAAKYTVTGEPNYSYSITLPGDADVTIEANSGANSMAIKSFTSVSGGTLVGGSDIFYVGGTLVVPAGQAIGVYTGSFSVSVNYN